MKYTSNYEIANFRTLTSTPEKSKILTPWTKYMYYFIYAALYISGNKNYTIYKWYMQYGCNLLPIFRLYVQIRLFINQMHGKCNQLIDYLLMPKMGIFQY